MPPFFKTQKIKPPKSLGEILRSRRKKMALSIKQAERATQIKRIYLVAIEENDWNSLPSEVYTAGFLNTYSKTLNLDSKRIIKHFKKELRAHKRINKKKIENPREIKVNRVYLTPKMVIISTIIALVLALGGYLWYQISGFAAAPKLSIIQPAGTEVKTAEGKIKLSGETDQDSSISLNNQPIPVDTKGYFEQEISLQKGINVFEVVSTNKAGKKTTKIVQVMME